MSDLSALPPHLIRAELLRRSFEDFVSWGWPRITGKPHVPNEMSRRMVAALQRVGDGEQTRTLIAMPPGVGKSVTLALYSAWRFARDPGHRAIHAGHSYEGLAKTESIRVRRLVEHDEFKAMFAVRLREDESTAGLWSTTENGIYIALGADSGVTGKRVSEAVLDDPMDSRDRHSKSVKESLWGWYSESLLSRLDGDDSPITIVHQRLGRDDLIGKLLEAGGRVEDGGEWNLLELPAELEDGTLLAPNVLSRAKLDKLKAPGAMGLAAFACQFLQQPSDDANATVKRTMWRFHRPPNVLDITPRPAGCDTEIPSVATPVKFDKIVIACDLTFGGLKSTNDLASIQVWGRVGVSKYLLGTWWKRATQLQQRDAIRDLKRQYPRAKIVVEKAAAGAGVLEQLAADGIDAIGVTPLGSKAERLDLVSPAIEAGNCYLPLGAPWLAAYVEELAGGTRHDDAQDATALALSELAVHTSDAEQARKMNGLGRMLETMASPWSGMPVTEPTRKLADHEQPAEVQRAINAAKNAQFFEGWLRNRR